MQEIYPVNGILEINHKCRGFCTIPYHNHPKGCPNYNVYSNCPPKIDVIENIFDLDRNMFFVVEEFNLGEHINKMEEKHPTWSLNQCKNLLYWQSGVRKKLKEKTEKFIEEIDTNMIYTLLPEAMGVMVINTALKLNIPIEKTPINKVFKIALVGYKIKSSTINYFR